QLENGKTYTLSAASVSNTVIEVASGRTATVVVPKNVAVTIDDYNNGCSPISLLGSGHLILVVDGTLTVTGGAATTGARSVNGTHTSTPSGASGNEVAGGKGGYAGISVPNGANLTVQGSGTLIAQGGDAAVGAVGGVVTDFGSGGGGGAGAGIGGNGGDGGIGHPHGTVSDNAKWTEAHSKAGNGGAAGNIYIYENITVKAYGGGGASGGAYAYSSGGGAGGYPAAGIGGGGAGGGGGDGGPSGSGFSAGQAESGASPVPTNGSADLVNIYGPGAGYFSSSVDRYNATGSIRNAGIGGGLAFRHNTNCFSGWGGNGGSGGAVYVGNKANITVANGSYVTTSAKQWGKTPTPIYLQAGFKPSNIRSSNVTSVSARTHSAMVTELTNKGISKTSSPVAVPGIGSGAGGEETSNGSYTIQKVPERVALAPRCT
ncbi:MAG: hypothetical protein HFI72_04595, partial [Peptococcaceae bacterium]|nr:hypothetical protein [Peptococcaceae bacterium]